MDGAPGAGGGISPSDTAAFANVLEAADLAAARWALQERLDAELPLDMGVLFASLHEAVASVHAAEVSALAALRSGIED